ncbi:hypothetical protein CBR_g21842 [Chara braunii]|uniref:U3 small nucleolar RNA-associated protein 18 homolog n=1 Tax=Chara braunii TaxID=69332 RepID=A0A388JUK5_CHABU|nr:hypothetical protein CBR_g21842 [Chara braunii]|eukprot:GBG61499.1 hypothetical protein CBR_g21842 [Chara braunii]
MDPKPLSSRGRWKKASEDREQEKAEEEEAKRLESLLFASGKGADEFRKEKLDIAPLPSSEVEDCDDGEREEEGEEVQFLGKKRRPAWDDPDEEGVVVGLKVGRRMRSMRVDHTEVEVSGAEYAKRLRKEYAKLNPRTEWAKLPSAKSDRPPVDAGDGLRLRNSKDSDESDEEGLGEVDAAEDADDLLRIRQPLIAKKSSRLIQGVLEIIPLNDANRDDPCQGRTKSVAFHPNGQLFMTGGTDKSLKFFQLDGKHNPKVQGIFLDNMPVQKAAFSGDGLKVFASGGRKFYYVYDILGGRVERVDNIMGREERSLETFELSPDNNVAAFLGKDGYVMLVSQRTKQWIANLKMNGTARTLAFTAGGQELITSGSDGDIYHWDMRTRQCIDKGKDEGCVRATAIASSLDGRYMATGGDTGVVNVYDRHKYLSGKRDPLKALMNLTTWVNCVKFNHDAQILAMSSNNNRDALRLVHVPSLTVFSNWPTTRTPLAYIHSLDFSPGGGFLAVGNSQGRALLYRLRHYDRA